MGMGLIDNTVLSRPTELRIRRETADHIILDSGRRSQGGNGPSRDCYQLDAARHTNVEWDCRLQDLSVRLLETMC